MTTVNEQFEEIFSSKELPSINPDHQRAFDEFAEVLNMIDGGYKDIQEEFCFEDNFSKT